MFLLKKNCVHLQKLELWKRTLSLSNRDTNTHKAIYSVSGGNQMRCNGMEIQSGGYRVVNIYIWAPQSLIKANSNPKIWSSFYSNFWYLPGLDFFCELWTLQDTVAAKKNASLNFANISSTDDQIFMKLET